MPQDYVFHFLSVRPADAARQLDRTSAKLDLYGAAPQGDSPLRAALIKLSGAEAAAEARRLIEQFRGSDRHVRTIDDLPFKVRPTIDVALAQARTPAAAAAVKKAFLTA